MALISKYANANTAIVTGYTDPTNAYANDANYATAAPAKNAGISSYFGFPGFTTGEIPDGSIINSVNVSLEYFVSATNSIPTQRIQVFRQTTEVDTEQSSTASPTSDTLLEHQVTSGVSLADLRTGNFVRAMVASNRGNTNTAVTFSIKYVQITVDWSDAPVDYTRSLNDAVAASDNTTREKIIEKLLADIVSASDSSTRQSAFTRVNADAVAASDNTTRGISAPMSGNIARLATRIGQEAKAIWTALAGKAASDHNHDGTYEPPIAKAPGYLTSTGSAWVWKNETYSLGTHNHDGTYEPAFSKNTAFNKAFGTTAGTVTEGSDSRLANTRTPTDASVTYAKLATDLTSRNTVFASDIDWNAGGVFTKTLTAAETFTFSNLKLNKVVTLVLTGNFTVTLPAYCKKIAGTYNGAVSNYIQFHCTNAASGSEEVWYTINQQAV